MHLRACIESADGRGLRVGVRLLGGIGRPHRPWSQRGKSMRWLVACWLLGLQLGARAAAVFKSAYRPLLYPLPGRVGALGCGGIEVRRERSPWERSRWEKSRWGRADGGKGKGRGWHGEGRGAWGREGRGRLGRGGLFKQW